LIVLPRRDFVMTITLPEVHRRWVEELAIRNGLTVDRVIAQLIEEAWESDEAEAQVLAAVNGPPAEPSKRSSH
jgi:hypothetical protein